MEVALSHSQSNQDLAFIITNALTPAILPELTLGVYRIRLLLE